MKEDQQEGPAQGARFLTPKEVADILKVSAESVRRACKAGSIPHMRIGGQYRIRASFLTEGAAGSV